ncbi:MAG: division/cell wall cluster transcriptional repressor MraZ [Burkholderiaceae bacterium]
MFEGPSALTLDGKGRVSMPSRYREDLQTLCAGRLTVTKHPHGCLMIFPRPHWEAFRDQLAQLPYSQVGVKRVFLGHADDVELDATSRVLIHPDLRAWAGLEKDVKLMGMGSHFELWSAAAYAAYEETVMRAEASAALDNLKF